MLKTKHHFCFCQLSLLWLKTRSFTDNNYLKWVQRGIVMHGDWRVWRCRGPSLMVGSVSAAVRYSRCDRTVRRASSSWPDISWHGSLRRQSRSNRRSRRHRLRAACLWTRWVRCVSLACTSTPLDVPCEARIQRNLHVSHVSVTF